MEQNRYNKLKEIGTRLQKDNEYGLTGDERVWARLLGISEGRFLTEKLIARMKSSQSPTEDKSDEI